jgi:predicted secreted protein
MAQPDIIRGTYFSLMLGDGAGPETFAALCGITTRNFTDQHNTNDQFTRDCADPENVPVRRLITTGRQWSLSGDGTLNRADLADIQAAKDGLPHNWRFLFSEPADDLVFQGYYAGPAILTTLTITGADDAFATISINLESDGEWVWTTV